MRRVQYETTPGRVILALLAGAMVGACLVAASSILSMELYSSNDPKLLELIWLGLFVGNGAFVIFAVGLSLVGGPAWLLLHNLGWRGWPEAIAVGILLTFAASLCLQSGWPLPPPTKSTYSADDSGGPLIINNIVTAHGWTIFVQQSMQLSIVGGIVGLTIWRIAYRRKQPTQT